ncbi:YeeE/YedE family protein [Mesorhizobium sp. LHD-90]|uniref:YeeE/YedE family protein n=1 Tax=Mesorhizobium sp. LHD-90 TaxID=3071414 RepID=UPI0027E0F04F|nr:YeeE/YedE family protein [Mesorhizobium sp. LHD-90]MDQ6434611.1 YeeE/YedE family protein [Mesorhizobium sp. LHD-90]
MSFLVNLALGLLVGAGLVVSGMADPAKVLNFLDLSGTWDPSLAFVMGGAVVVAFVGYRLVLRRESPIVGTDFHLPAKSDIDARVIAGPAIFGIGWGLGGFCPGPALTALGLGAVGTLAFAPAMLVGMGAARFIGETLPHPTASQGSH